MCPTDGHDGGDQIVIDRPQIHREVQIGEASEYLRVSQNGPNA